MRSLLHIPIHWVRLFLGALPKDPKQWPRTAGEWAWFRASVREYRRRLGELNVDEPLEIRPILFQRTPQMPFDAHYVYQGAWALQRILQIPSERHVDVSSNIPFVAMLSTQKPILFLEYNPPRLDLPNVEIQHASVTELPFADRSLPSLSCLHVVEHIGLGRYGDPLDPRGSEKACRELARCVAPGGSLFLSTPIGRRRTQFNAHRIFDPMDIPRAVPDLELHEFSVVTDDKKWIVKTDPSRYAELNFGCGLYWFRRPTR